jgi:hypothetical protein
MAAAAAGVGRGAAKAAEVGALASAARRKAPRVRIRSGYKSAQRPVITTLTVTVGLSFLDAWLVPKNGQRRTMPDRELFVRLAILGFFLALLTEITPRLGKGMSYLVLTGVVFDRSQSILRELQNPRRAPAGAGTDGTGPGPSPLTPQNQPVTLYVRQGPMTTEPLLPVRTRIKRPKAGAWAQA